MESWVLIYDCRIYCVKFFYLRGNLCREFTCLWIQTRSMGRYILPWLFNAQLLLISFITQELNPVDILSFFTLRLQIRVSQLDLLCVDSFHVNAWVIECGLQWGFSFCICMMKTDCFIVNEMSMFEYVDFLSSYFVIQYFNWESWLSCDRRVYRWWLQWWSHT